MKKLSYQVQPQTTYKNFFWIAKDMGYDDIQKAEIYLPAKPISATLHIDVDPNAPGVGHGCMLNIKVNGVTVANFGMFPNCDVWEGDVTEYLTAGPNYIIVNINKNVFLFWAPLGSITGYLEYTLPPSVTPTPGVETPPPVIITPTPTPIPFTLGSLSSLIILLFLILIIFMVFKK